MHRNSRWTTVYSRCLRYGIAIFVVFIALWLRLFLTPFLGDVAPFLPFVLAVLLSAWYGGFWPGLCSTILSTLLVDYVWLPPRYSWAIANPWDLILLGVFFVAGFSISSVYEVLHRARCWNEATSRALQRSEEQYLRLLATAAEGIWFIDANAQITYVNQRIADILGYTVEEMLHCSLFDFFCEADLEQAASYYQRLYQGGKEQHDVRWRRKDGSEVWVLASTSPVLNEQGEFLGALQMFTDITKRRYAEAALYQNEEQLRLALNASQMGIWDWDLRTGSVVWSQGSEMLFGLAPGTFAGTYEAFMSAVYPGDRAAVEQAIVAFLEQGQNYEQEFRIVWPDGSIHWIEGKGQLIYNSAGELIRAVGTNTDITDRKQAILTVQQQTDRERLIAAMTQRLRQSLHLEEILKTTVAEVREFLQVDRVLICQRLSDETGVVAVESVGAEWLVLRGTKLPVLKPAFIQRLQCGEAIAIADIYTAGLEPDLLEMLIHFQVHADLLIPILQGDLLWGVLIAHHCLAPRDWQPSEIDLLKQLAAQLAIAIQQSELYHQVQRLNTTLERQVEERTHRLQQALDFEAVLKRITDKVRDSLDESQILQTAVCELAQVLGADGCNAALYNLDQGIATVCYEYTTANPAFQGRLLQLAAFPEIYQPLLEGRCYQFCSILSNPVCYRSARLACPIVDDQGVLGDLWLRHQADYCFSEPEIRLVQQVASQCAIAIRQARLYQAVQAQVEVLERLNQLKDDFLSTVSHELRTPVSNMKMSIRMLELALAQELPETDLPRRSHRYLKILHDECEREISLINDLLDLQRLEVGRQPLELTTIHLQTWLPEAIQPFLERTQARQQQLQIQVSPELAPLVSDRLSLERIIGELLNNACKYTPPGGKIMAVVQTTAAHIQLQVLNSGVEIPLAELPRIFDKFYRVPSTDPWKQGGTGLGLALVRKLAHHLGGEVYVSSTAGWTTFTLELPQEFSAAIEENSKR